MVSNLSASKLAVLGAGALLASSLLLFLGTGLHPAWYCLWFAPLPILLVAPHLRAIAAFGLSALSWFVGSLNLWHYLVGLIQIPIPVMLAILLVGSCVFGGVALVHRALVRRKSYWLASLSLPLLWLTYEFGTALLSPHSTFGNVAYSQMDFLPILQIASVTGLWGISFCVFLFPSAAAAILHGRAAGGQRKLLIVIAGFLSCVLLFGFWRLYHDSEAEGLVSIAMIASDRRETLFPENDDSSLKLLRDYSERFDRIHQSGTNGDRVILLPEKLGVISDQGVKDADAMFASTAMRMGATIVVGVDHGSRVQRFNEARVYSPQGSLLGIYVKHHLIPGFEDVDRPGHERLVRRESSGVWGVEICKDMDFPALSRQYGGAGIGLLLVPAWDFDIDRWLHGRMAVMRGVESGFTIARAAKQGLLTISDNRGRILAETSSSVGTFSLLQATAPVQHENTLYVRWGNWFAWLNLAGAFVVIGTLFRVKPVK